jgi:hypothetical protein
MLPCSTVNFIRQAVAIELFVSGASSRSRGTKMYPAPLASTGGRYFTGLEVHQAAIFCEGRRQLKEYDCHAHGFLD